MVTLIVCKNAIRFANRTADEKEFGGVGIEVEAYQTVTYNKKGDMVTAGGMKG